MSRHLSNQARRRLDNTLHGPEWSDLAAEIADALEEEIEFNSAPWVIGETERAVIYTALRGTHSSQEHD